MEITVQTPDELLSLLEKDPERILANLHKVKLGRGFNLHVSVSGRRWDGQIDYKVASFIIGLQQDILNIYSELTGEDVNFRNKSVVESLRVTVTIKDGSLDALADLSNLFLMVLSKLEATHITIILLAGLAAWAGKGIFKSRNDKIIRLAEIEKDKHASEDQRQIIQELVRGMTDMVNNSVNGIRNIASSMGKRDEFVLIDDMSGEEDKYSKEKLIKIIPAKSKKVESFNRNVEVWGNFKVTITDHERQVYTLSADGVKPFNAKSPFINAGVQKDFFDNYVSQIPELHAPQMFLRLQLDITEGGKISQAMILAVLDKGLEESAEIPVIQKII